MPRIEIKLPKEFLFSTDVPVRVTDLNYGGHVGNDRVLSIMHEARVQFYRHLGFKDELSFGENVGQIITDVAVVYKSESFLGDVITVQISVTDFNKYGFDMMYLLTNKATGKEIARGKTGIVCFDYGKRKITGIPSILKIKIEQISDNA